MDHNLYDEFGNYNGPEIESEQESDGEEEDEQLPDKPHENEEASDGKEAIDASNGWVTTANDVDMDNQIVLAEDKKYYPTAEEVYGEDVDTLTLFMDMLVEQTRHMLTFNTNCEKHMRYTDTRIDEQQRRISIKVVPMSPVLEDSNSKSYLCDIMDIPGHVNFSDEMTAGFADGAVLIVDAAEGVMVKMAICHAIQEHLPIVVVINKDAYHKLGHTTEVINNHIKAVSSTAGNVQVLNPGNVCLQVLREDGPLLCNHLLNLIGEHKKSIGATLAKLGVILPKAAYKLNFQSLLRLGCSSVFGSASGFTDMLVQPIPSAKNAAAKKVDHIYLGPNDSMIYKAMVADPVVSFSEIVVESSSMKCFDGTPNKKNKVTMVRTEEAI
ncbi:hypothetical protein GH714_012320 [Hevea brasiliensis]|uniref:Tr-type G domain-containing protein n=1 Tax=Hevea brasiliensis TaxID=3981 RepID=A0A6A6MVF0_HEVBR|nr:hypothetical protein GH714_012320 [Hevea brasiliensis]